MKLDRNINPDGKGKYALINLRTNKVEWGASTGCQFFVIKYTDRFAYAALKAYARAVLDRADELDSSPFAKKSAKSVSPAQRRLILKQARELREYAEEITAEALTAAAWTTKKDPD